MDEAELCRRIERYIRENISRIVTEKELAGHFYISTRSVSRKIRTHYNMSFRELANGIRCECAKELLAHSALTVSEISERLGFSGPANFNHFFTREEGHSPTAYRKIFNEANR